MGFGFADAEMVHGGSTGEQIVSYFDWAKESAMKGTRKLTELEACADHALLYELESMCVSKCGQRVD
jgi:hypothetical protein